MKTITPQTLWNKADHLVEDAKKEIDFGVKPDVYKICMSCKHGIIHYLNGYLIQHDVQPNKIQTMSVLFAQCQEINADFKSLDLSSINCRFELPNDDHCTELTDLRECLDTTQHIQKFVKTIV